jgi:hypothetical protein
MSPSYNSHEELYQLQDVGPMRSTASTENGQLPPKVEEHSIYRKPRTLNLDFQANLAINERRPDCGIVRDLKFFHQN